MGYGSQGLQHPVCQFLGSSAPGRNLPHGKGLPVLTIGEMPDFARRGGIINFIMEDNKVRFEVNVDAAKQADMNISSRLLALAKIVPQTGRMEQDRHESEEPIHQAETDADHDADQQRRSGSFSASFLIYDLISFRHLLSQ